MRRLTFDRLKFLFLRSKPTIALFGLALCSISLIAIMSAWYVNFDAERTAFFTPWGPYEQTMGVIISSTVKHKTVSWGQGSRRFQCYAIKYRYTIGGTPYDSDRITFAHPCTNLTDNKFIQEYLNKYPVGRVVSVFYKVSSPSFAVLEPDKRDSRTRSQVVYGIFILGAVIFFLFREKTIIWKPPSTL